MAFGLSLQGGYSPKGRGGSQVGPARRDLGLQSDALCWAPHVVADTPSYQGKSPQLGPKIPEAASAEDTAFTAKLHRSQPLKAWFPPVKRK